MKLQEARNLIKATFENPFDKGRFTLFVNNLLKDSYEEKSFVNTGGVIPQAFAEVIRKMERIGKYEDDEGNIIDILAVELKKGRSIEWARTAQRNFIRRYLNGSRGGELKDAALVAFYSEGSSDWRFSLIKMQYSLEKKKDELTPAKRFSFLVGTGEKSHTAQNQLAELLTLDGIPTLAEIESAFNIETVTKEFFEKYRELFLNLNDTVEKEIKKSKSLREELERKGIDSVSFTKKLLGQIVFLYFLQKKGWLGVPRNEQWNKGDKQFLRSLLTEALEKKKNFFSDYLVYLFYEALATEHRGGSDPSYYPRFNCRIPFLNGGLFEADYDWSNIKINIPNRLFTNTDKAQEGDIGTGVLDVFDRYNFTVKEDEPLEKEVAVDPEMLGKVFENLLEVKDRKSKGAYYTPREIVHYMCQESLIEYLDATLNVGPESFQKLGSKQSDMFGNKTRSGQLPLEVEHGNKIKLPKKDLVKLIREGASAIDNDTLVEEKGFETRTIKYNLPDSIRNYADELDKALANIRICDPAIGSGAFPVGIMNEIVKAREILSVYIKNAIPEERSTYELKRHAIQECIYGVDIDHSAIDIAKLRLWLSLVVDEDDFYKIKPLPNLDYKIVCGNSLIGYPFEPQGLDEIEKLKNKFFELTAPEKKQEYRVKINDAINSLLNNAEKTLGYKVDFDFEIHFSEVFHYKKGFDIVIGNPPYIGQKGHKEMFQEIKATPFGKKYHQRRMDLFYFFFHLGINKLRSGGVLSFITTNYFLTATYSDKLRNHIHGSTSILRLFNFNELKVFESAQGQHNLITLLKKEKSNDIIAHTAVTDRRGLADEIILNSILFQNDELTAYYKQKQENIFEKDTLYIRIEPEHSAKEKDNNITIHSVLNKVRQGSTPLATFIDITTGIQSSSDKVTASFLKKYPAVKAEIGEGIYLLTNKELASKNFTSNDKKHIKKTYKNSDIERWTFFPDNKLNVIYVKSDGNDLEISDGIKKHLDKYKLILVNRNVRVGKITIKDYEEFVKGKKEISYIMNASAMKRGNYYCVSYARGGKDTFEVPKIVNPRRAKTNVFAYEDRGFYEQSDVVVSTLKKKYEKSLDLKYLLAIINSKLIYKWLYFKGKRKGDMLELFQKPIGEIPIRIIENQNLLINKVQRILDSKAKDTNANIVALEKQIDIMVYHLYNLNYEEAKIIDPALTEEEFDKYELLKHA
jgi:hypothetical protein